MTEELKQKAIDFEKNWFDRDIAISDLLIEFATEATKKLQEENEHLKEVHKSDCKSLTMIAEKGRELEKQIEKMKCGQNCKHSYLYQEDRKCKFTYCDCINCKDKWELAE